MFRPHLYGPLVVLATMVGVGMLVVSWTKRWGSTAAEVAWQLPGDSIVPHPMVVTTRAITIDAPASAIWPWLVQLGWHRAGWYSYDRIDNDHRQSVDHINPAWQDLGVGDLVPEGPEVGWTVVEMTPARSLLLESHGPMAGVDWVAGRDSSWLFLLEPKGENTTRLIERSRTAVAGDRATMLGRLMSTAPAADLLAIGDFVMARKHLRGIKQRAESSSEGLRYASG